MVAATRTRWKRWLIIAPALALLACSLEDIGAPVAGTLFVSIKDNYFQPDTLAVAQGGTVRWTNEGAVLHSVVSDSGPWQSPLLSPTSWFDVRFDSLGTFPYHCSLHQGMTGVVVVQ